MNGVILTIVGCALRLLTVLMMATAHLHESSRNHNPKPNPYPNPKPNRNSKRIIVRRLAGRFALYYVTVHQMAPFVLTEL